MRTLILGLVAAALLALGCPAAAEVRGTVEIVGDKPIVLSVAPATGDPSLAALVTGKLRNDLEHAHWTTVLPWSGGAPAAVDRLAAAEVPAGANFVVCATVQQEAGEVALLGYVFSADGTRQLAKEYRVKPGRVAEASHRFADDVVRELTEQPGFASTTIAYVAQFQGKPAIYGVSPDGGESRKLVSGKFECLFPKFAPTRRWLVYTAFPRGFPELMLFDPLSARNMTLSARAGMNSLGAVSPDAKLVAATLSFEGNPEVYVLDMAGKVERRLTNNRGCDLSPCWSPDGSQVAFVSDRSGSPAIYVVDAEGRQEPKRLTFPFNSSNYCVTPAWSPKGDFIAFCARVSGHFDVQMVRVADEQFFRVTEGGGDEEAPDWAPDNRHVVVASTKAGQTGLEVIDTRRPQNRFSIPLPQQVSVRDPTWCKVVY